jgi:hypothetical protein
MPTVLERIARWGRVDWPTEPEVIKRFEALVLALARIRLLADPLDEQHCRILALMHDQIQVMKVAPPDADIASQIEAMGSQIVELSVSILRREWARIKRLD